MTAVTHPTRTEHEVAADAVMAALRALATAGLLRLTGQVVEVSAGAAGLSLAELREADGRRERGMYVRPKDRPVIPGGVPLSVPQITAATTVGAPTLGDPDRRWCAGCSRLRHPSDFDSDTARCRRCLARARDRYHSRKADRQERDETHRALVRAVAPVTDVALNEERTGFELVCKRCRRPIGRGEAVVCLTCAGDG